MTAIDCSACFVTTCIHLLLCFLSRHTCNKSVVVAVVQKTIMMTIVDSMGNGCLTRVGGMQLDASAQMMRLFIVQLLLVAMTLVTTMVIIIVF